MVGWGTMSSTSGCPYGEGCHFLHYVPGGIAALPGLMMPMTASAAGTGTCLYSATSGGGGWGPGLNNLGTEINTGGGPPGSLYACSTAAADPATTSVGSFKTRLCNRFSMPDGCRFGERCHFAHGESDLRPSNGISSLHSNGFEYMVSSAVCVCVSVCNSKSHFMGGVTQDLDSRNSMSDSSSSFAEGMSKTSGSNKLQKSPVILENRQVLKGMQMGLEHS